MVKLSDLITEGKMNIGAGDYANIYDMKKEIKDKADLGTSDMEIKVIDF